MRKRRIIRSTTAVLSIAAMFALSACGASGGQGQSDGTVHWLTERGQNDPTILAVRQIADAYAEEHPDFKLEIETVPDRPTMDQKLRTLAASKELPEMFDADPEPFFKSIVDSGQVADIGALYDELGVAESFFPISVSYPRWSDGSLNLMTLQANVEYFWWNTKLFEQAGVEPPATLSELEGVCSDLDAAGITPIAINGKDQWPFYRYLAMPAFRETGNDFIDALKAGDESMSGETGERSIEFLESMSGCFQDGFSNTDLTTAVNLFATGEAAMMYIGSWQLPNFLAEDGELKPEFSTFQIPASSSDDVTSAETDYFAVSGIGTAIRKDALTPELKDFLSYFFENYGDVAFNDFHIIPSVRPDVDTATLPRIYQQIFADLEKNDVSAKVWDVQLDPGTNTVLGRESTNLLIGQTSAEDFANRVDESIESYLSKQ